jgi:regulatory protein
LRSRDTEPITATQAYQYAVRLLTGRDYSVAAIGQKLALRGIAPQDSEQLLLRLQNEGWLDDTRYAERFAESSLASGRFYGVRLRNEMRRRGFDAELIHETLASLLEERDEVSEVRATVARRYPAFCYADADGRERQRVIGFLQRHGFGFSAIIQALRTEE